MTSIKFTIHICSWFSGLFEQKKKRNELENVKQTVAAAFIIKSQANAKSIKVYVALRCRMNERRVCVRANE